MILKDFIGEYSDNNNNVINSEVKTTIDLNGSYNNITIKKTCGILVINLNVSGNNNKLFVGQNCTTTTRGIYINIFGNSELVIEGNTFINYECNFYCHNSIVVHKDSLFSWNIILNDEFGDIDIGEHTWIGQHATVLGDTKIGKGCILGAGTIVFKKDIPDRSVIGGSPAKILKSNMRWSRNIFARDFHDIDMYKNEEKDEV